MHPAFDQIALLHGITQALDVITVTAITAAAVVVIMTHAIPEEAVPQQMSQKLLKEEISFL